MNQYFFLWNTVQRRRSNDVAYHWKNKP